MKLLDRIRGTDTAQQVDRARDALDDVDHAMDRVLAAATQRLIDRPDGDQP